MYSQTKLWREHERVEQATYFLKRNLAAPPSLEELGKKIGCSPFYLSRIFFKRKGQTISEYLGKLRKEGLWNN
jgi:AraC family transcriptional regulator